MNHDTQLGVVGDDLQLSFKLTADHPAMVSLFYGVATSGTRKIYTSRYDEDGQLLVSIWKPRGIVRLLSIVPKGDEEEEEGEETLRFDQRESQGI